jgi:hypothetical protein
MLPDMQYVRDDTCVHPGTVMYGNIVRMYVILCTYEFFCEVGPVCTYVRNIAVCAMC